MKRFTIPCDFAGVSAPFNVYIGNPVPGSHPLKYQAAWLLEERGGVMPSDVMESFQKLYEVSRENEVSFEELCVYALGSKENTEDSSPQA
jgi:hypothetical protein